jgi:CrcB protein
MMIKLLAISLGGMIGALLRYGVGGLTHRFTSGDFPYGTMLVNLTGCLVIGLLWGLFERSNFPSALRLFLFIGVLGSYTTFSSFGLETFTLFRDGEVRLGLYNILITNTLGLLLVFAGYFAVRWFLGLAK